MIEKRIDLKIASRILRKIPHNNAFFFFTGIGQYTGKFATSLSDFCEKIKTADLKSVNFHFQRQDFEEWIRTTIEDSDLANELNEIKKSVQGEELRLRIYRVVEKRLEELKKLLASEETYLKRI